MSPALFGVERSLAGARWSLAPVDAAAAQALMRAHGVEEVVARLLAGRGVAPGAVDGFLNPTLRRDFPDPLTMADMAGAAKMAARAVLDGRGIALFGDFDVDGATSTAVLARFFRALGARAPIYIPDRLAEGYGPNAKALQTLRGNGADLVILADCGTTALATMEAGKAAGLDLIILDHHEAGERLSAADFTVNPKRADDRSGLGMLAAVGVSLMFCVAVNRALREDGFYAGTGRAEPPIRDWLDIVALGTVCDMVPLTGPNRLFVRQGLARMATTTNPGLRALLEVAKVKGPPSATHMGFSLGPRINAGGRIHKSDLGARLLSTDDEEEARSIAFMLDECNTKRRAMQAQMEREAVAKVEAQGLAGDPAIVVADEAWHPGLAGLVAGRLKDKYKRPACVVTFAKSGQGVVEGRGSGRSVPGMHIAQAFMDAHAAGLLLKGGGHAMAGGFTVAPEQIDALRTFICEHVERQRAGGEAAAEARTISAALSVRGASVELAELVEGRLGPFGQGAAEPVFALPEVRVRMADVVGNGHVRVQVSDAEGGPRMKGIAFRAEDKPLGQALLGAGDRPIHIAGALVRNEWQGRVSAEMHIHDGAWASG